MMAIRLAGRQSAREFLGSLRDAAVGKENEEDTFEQYVQEYLKGIRYEIRKTIGYGESNLFG